MVKIISDSTCDLSPDLLERYQVQIVPLHVILGDNDYKDGELKPEEIFRWSDDNSASPKTAACNLEDAIAAIKPHLDNGDEVIAFTISASMSSSNQVMRMAAEHLDAEDRVHVIDSQSLSSGVALLVVAAAEMAAKGMAATEIAAQVKALRPQVRASFVVDTLTYLARGGRCSSVSALLGGALKLHPRIAVTDGAMSAGKKYRGKMDSVIRSYVTEMEDELRAARPEHVFIAHSGCDEKIIGYVREYLASLNHFAEIHSCPAGGVISCHCGPGTLGVLFIAQ